MGLCCRASQRRARARERASKRGNGPLRYSRMGQSTTQIGCGIDVAATRCLRDSSGTWVRAKQPGGAPVAAQAHEADRTRPWQGNASAQRTAARIEDAIPSCQSELMRISSLPGLQPSRLGAIAAALAPSRIPTCEAEERDACSARWRNRVVPWCLPFIRMSCFGRPNRREAPAANTAMAKANGGFIGIGRPWRERPTGTRDPPRRDCSPRGRKVLPAFLLSCCGCDRNGCAGRRRMLQLELPGSRK